MKPRQIRRNLESRHVRTLGGAPDLGRVSRVRGSGRPGSRHQKVEEPFLRRYQRLLIIAAVILMVLAVLGGGVWVGFRARARTVAGEVAAPIQSKSDEQVRIVSKFKSPSERVALNLVLQALRSHDESEVRARFRLTESSAKDASVFLAAMRADEIEANRLRWLGSLDMQDLCVEGVLVDGVEGASGASRMAFLIPDAKGEWKVDFDAFARTGNPGWNSLLKGNAEQSRVRVLMEKKYYYNGIFAEESVWSCFGMVSPEADGFLSEENRLMYGYCRKDSPQAKAMERLVAAGVPIMRATLEIRRTGGEPYRQFEITRVLSEDWVMPDKPSDERFQ